MEDMRKLCGSLFAGFCVFGLLVATLLPLSLFYEAHTVVKVFWWIFWILSIPLGCAILPYNRKLYQSAKESSNNTGRRWCVFFLTCSLCCWTPVFLSGMFILSEASILRYLHIQDGVTPESISKFYDEGQAEVYVFLWGYLQQEPRGPTQFPFSRSQMMTVPCHGYTVQRTCQRESCRTVNGRRECRQEQYDCSYDVFPDNCPGYHLSRVTALWQSSADVEDSSASPAALMFQSRSYLFDVGEETLLQQHLSAQQALAVPLGLCRGGDALCGVDLRNSHAHAHWDERYGKEVTNPSGVGRTENFNAPTVEQALAEATAAVPSMQAPLLWMPQDAELVLQKMEAELGDAKDKKPRGEILSALGAGIPGGLLFFAICCALPAGGLRVADEGETQMNKP